MKLTLRIRKQDQRLPTEHVLSEVYSLDEAQEIINEAIDEGESVQLMLHSGDIVEFDPTEYQVISVAYPTDLTERK